MVTLCSTRYSTLKSATSYALKSNKSTPCFPLMDVLRQMALREGVAPAEKSVPAFHRAFLASVRKWGRVFEVGMLAGFSLKSGKGMGVLKDASLGWQMFKRGKLGLWPARVRQRRQIRDIFRRARRGDGA